MLPNKNETIRVTIHAKKENTKDLQVAPPKLIFKKMPLLAYFINCYLPKNQHLYGHTDFNSRGQMFLNKNENNPSELQSIQQQNVTLTGCP